LPQTKPNLEWWPDPEYTASASIQINEQKNEVSVILNGAAVFANTALLSSPLQLEALIEDTENAGQSPMYHNFDFSELLAALRQLLLPAQNPKLVIQDDVVALKQEVRKLLRELQGLRQQVYTLYRYSG